MTWPIPCHIRVEHDLIIKRHHYFQNLLRKSYQNATQQKQKPAAQGRQTVNPKSKNLQHGPGIRIEPITMPTQIPSWWMVCQWWVSISIFYDLIIIRAIFQLWALYSTAANDHHTVQIKSSGRLVQKSMSRLSLDWPSMLTFPWKRLQKQGCWHTWRRNTLQRVALQKK